MSKANTTYKIALADYLSVSSENISFFWKGRVALYALMKAYGIKKDDEVILPAFTCVVVPNAIIYCQAKPIYVDINPQTLNCDAEEIRKKITQKTKFIIAQNTFGLSSDLDAIMVIAKEKNIIVIEDCTHGLGGFYKGRKNGTIADASFFSTQWNKPFSTGIGGMAYVHDKDVAKKMKSIEKTSKAPSFLERVQLSVLLSVRSIMKAPAVYWPMIKLYRFLSKNNLVVGSSQGNELDNPILPDDFLKQMANVQLKKGISELMKLNQYVSHRVKVAAQYDEALRKLGFKINTHKDHSYLKYPLLVKNRKLFFELAAKKNIELGDWFISPIHPITEQFHLWQYDFGKFPIAEYVSAQIVNLPTHIDMGPKAVERVLSFLNENKDQLLSFE